MKIDIEKIEEKAVPAFKGGEKEYNVRTFDDGLNKIMKGRLSCGASIGTHKHEGSSEIIYILKGKGVAIFDGERIELSAGDVHYCPNGHTHCLKNESQEDLQFIAVVPVQN